MQVVKLADLHEWQFLEVIKNVLDADHSDVTQTNLVEDNFFGARSGVELYLLQGGEETACLVHLYHRPNREGQT